MNIRCVVTGRTSSGKSIFVKDSPVEPITLSLLPGMHTTDTVDFDVVLSGEIYLELDDGSEVLLKAGDCVIQNGTRHAWQNRSAKDCISAVALIGADR